MELLETGEVMDAVQGAVAERVSRVWPGAGLGVFTDDSGVFVQWQDGPGEEEVERELGELLEVSGVLRVAGREVLVSKRVVQLSRSMGMKTWARAASQLLEDEEVEVPVSVWEVVRRHPSTGHLGPGVVPTKEEVYALTDTVMELDAEQVGDLDVARVMRLMTAVVEVGERTTTWEEDRVAEGLITLLSDMGMQDADGADTLMYALAGGWGLARMMAERA